MVKELNERLADRDLKVTLDEEAKTFITQKGYDPVYGARPLKRYLQKTVETIVARVILEGEVGMGDTIEIHVEDDRLYATVAAEEGK